MSRQPRNVFVNVPHHITQRGNYRQDVFFCDEDREHYLQWLKEYKEKYGLEIWAYCLMSNHIHLIAVPRQENALARTLAATHMRYSQYFNKKQNQSGHLWQGRFYSCPIDEFYLPYVARYVERNPVRARMVVEAVDWHWSSANAHVNGDESELLKGATWPPKELLKDWKEMLLTYENEKMIGEIRIRTTTGRPLGSKSFVEKLEGIAGRVLGILKAGRPKKTE